MSQSAAPAPIPNPFREATLLARLLHGYDISAYLDHLPQPWRELADAILACPDIPSQRAATYEAALACLPGAASIRSAVFAADPNADLDRLLAEIPAPSIEVDVPELPDSARLDPALCIGAGACSIVTSITPASSPR